MIWVGEGLELPEAELTFTTSRSGGPGGQNVNKVDTRVTLLFDVAGSPSLSEEQRALIRERLSGRINKEGVLRVVSSRHRTQFANREAAQRRFVELLQQALMPDKDRIRVPVPAAAKERRLQAKRHRKRVKRERTVDLTLED